MRSLRVNAASRSIPAAHGRGATRARPSGVCGRSAAASATCSSATGARSKASLQSALDERADRLLDALTCPVTGTSVREALRRERLVLQPVPTMEAPFDVVVSRPVSRDCLVSFEGRRYSVPFAWAGRHVEVY